MKAVQSFLGLSFEDRNKQKAGYGGYGFPLLIRILKPKKGDCEEKQLSRKEQKKLLSSPQRIELLGIRDRSMGLRDCLVKMYSRRVAVRKHADEVFDKCTSEYYSCGKKGVQNRRLACKFSHEMGIVDYPDCVDVNAHSSTSDSELSESSAPSDDHNIDVEVQKMSVFASVSTENRDHLHDGSGDCDVGFCLQHGYDKEESSWECDVSSLSLSPARGVLRKKFPPPLNMLAIQSYSNKRGQSPEACTAGYCLRSFRRDGRFVLQEVKSPTHKYFRVLREDGRLKLELFNAVGDSSQEDDETSASDVCVGVKTPMVGVVTEVLNTSNTHAEDTCKGSPHLGMHALSNEMKTKAGSNTGCVSTYELMSTLSQEDDDTSASDVCVGVKSPMVGVTEALYTSNTHADDTSPHLGMHALCDEMKTGAASNKGCVNTCELMSTLRANAGVAKPLEHVISAASDIQRKSKAKAEAVNISSDVWASADERMPQADLSSAEGVGTEDTVSPAKGVGTEDTVSPLIESPSSPRCPEMRTLYDGPSASIKRSWVCPISAF